MYPNFNYAVMAVAAGYLSRIATWPRESLAGLRVNRLMLGISTLDVRCQSSSNDGVRWVIPAFSRGAVDRAGDILRDSNLETVLGWIIFRDEADDVINNWRSSHRYPMQVIRTALKKRAESLDPAALISSRTKRVPAIKSKLGKRKEGVTPRLSKMQDIGGCRAVVRNVSRVKRLVEILSDRERGLAAVGAILGKPFDYISKPKSNGYRSHHLVFQYRANTKVQQPFDGLKIEVQIRSQRQHQWATAVETVDFFTGQQLKSDVGAKDWKRFFALASSAVALIEDCPLVPGTPHDPDELRDALRVYEEQLDMLHGFSSVTESIERGPKGNLFLLEVDWDEKELNITSFRQDEVWEADDAYREAEAKIRNRPGGRVALVTADSLSALRKAYPNYFLDTRDFAATIDAFLDVGEDRF